VKSQQNVLYCSSYVLKADERLGPYAHSAATAGRELRCCCGADNLVCLMQCREGDVLELLCDEDIEQIGPRADIRGDEAHSGSNYEQGVGVVPWYGVVLWCRHVSMSRGWCVWSWYAGCLLRSPVTGA